ncbi:MAG: energy transducer TonB [Proteobacteria bacterium]|nr:energy transducer TonB [Pseudomonadota bacterium]
MSYCSVGCVLLGARVKTYQKKDHQVWNDLPRYGRKLLWLAIAISACIHILSIMGTFHFGDYQNRIHDPAAQQVRLKINSVSTPSKTDLEGKKVLETPQIETKAPRTADYVGPKDHATDRETKLKKQLLNEDLAKDAGKKGKENADSDVKSAPVPKQMISGPGTLLIPGTTTAPRNNYERLLPNRVADVFGSPNAGHTEYIDKDIPEGDKIDMNTTSFRYISYFTGMRKAIEMVWIYPKEAVERGLQGQVQLELVIEKDGKVSRVRVVNSSGYAVLDDNMIKTIKLASPFAPLPKGWNKDRIQVTGAFHYLLSYGAH